MKTTEFLKENSIIAQEADDMHKDHEVQMARSQMYSAAQSAIEIHKLLKNISELEGLDGWVASNRDLGGCAFIDLRDRYGVTQVKFDPTVDAALAAAAAEVRPEWVVAITGVVVSRGSNTNKQGSG